MAYDFNSSKAPESYEHCMTCGSREFVKKEDGWYCAKGCRPWKRDPRCICARFNDPHCPVPGHGGGQHRNTNGQW